MRLSTHLLGLFVVSLLIATTGCKTIDGFYINQCHDDESGITTTSYLEIGEKIHRISIDYSNDPNCNSSAVGGFYVVGDIREIHNAGANTFIVEFNIETQIASEQRGVKEKRHLLNALKDGGTYIPPDHEARFMNSGILEYLPKVSKQFVKIEQHGSEVWTSKHVDTFIEALNVNVEFNFYSDPKNFHKYFEFIKMRIRADLWDLTPLPSATKKTIDQ